MAYTAIVLCVLLICNVIIAQPVQQKDNKDVDRTPLKIVKKFVLSEKNWVIFYF